MDNTLKKLSFFLVAEFVTFLLLISCIVIIGYSDLFPYGTYTGKTNANASFVLNTVAVCISFVAVWLSIKLFTLYTEKNIKKLNFDSALHTYHIWSNIRLFILFITIAFDLIVYFLTLEDTCLFFAVVILLISFIYCVPSKSKLIDYWEKMKDDI